MEIKRLELRQANAKLVQQDTSALEESPKFHAVRENTTQRLLRQLVKHAKLDITAAA